MEEKTLVKGGSFLSLHDDPESIFTLEQLTDEQRMIQKTAEDFVYGEVFPHLPEMEEQQNFEHAVRLLKEAGALGLVGGDVPEEFGGLQLDKVSTTLITEKLAIARSFGLTFGAHTGIGTLPIVFFGTKKQKERYLPGLASGEKVAAYALTEPGSGSDALGAKTTAVLSDDGEYYLLNGEKQWITNAGFADVFIVYAKIDGERFTAFIVEKDFPGVSTGREEKKMGIKGSSTRTLILQDARVPVKNVLGSPGEGHRIAFNILNIGRYKLAAGCVGTSKRALELSASYAKERRQFGRPIAQFPLIQEKLARMATRTFAQESIVYRTAGLIEDRLSDLTSAEDPGMENADAMAEYAVECSINKVYASEAFDQVIDEAVQIHGGYGFMQEYEVETLYRDSRINRIFEGTNEINRLLIPGTLLKRVMKGTLPLLQEASELEESVMGEIMQPPNDSPLPDEAYKTAMAKRIFLLCAGRAAEQYGEELESQQEILSDLADMVIWVYVMDSCLRRTLQAMESGEKRTGMMEDMTRLIAQEGMEETERAAKCVLAAMEEGDSLRMHLSVLKKFTRYLPVNGVEIKRRIAQRILKAEKYVV